MTMRGGKREGSGRPRGATNRLSKVAVERAMATGEENAVGPYAEVHARRPWRGRQASVDRAATQDCRSLRPLSASPVVGDRKPPVQAV